MKTYFAVWFMLVLMGCSNSSVCPPCTSTISSACPKESCPSCNCTPTQEQVCPTITVIKNYTYTKYVCPNGDIVQKTELCFPTLTTSLVPITTNEQGTHIKFVDVEPACLYGVNGGFVKFSVGSIADQITIQVRTDTESYTDVYSTNNLFEGTRNFAISDKRVQSDFMLSMNKAYLLRVKFRIAATNLTEYSNEHFVDTRRGSDYMTKVCSSK